MPRRDYILGLIEELARVIHRIVLQRETGQYDQAVHTVIHEMERLFGLTVTELADLDANRLYAQLTQGEHPGNARDKCLMFAALNNQAGLAYAEKDLQALAQPAFHLALIFTLRALTDFSRSNLPPFTPKVHDLLVRLEGFALPQSTQDLLESYQDSP